MSPNDCLVQGSVSTGITLPSGLQNAGRFTEVTINDTTWTALPPTPLTGRNAISIQNASAFQLKLNYDPLLAGYTGVYVNSGTERFYDITDTILIYAKAAPGAGSVIIGVEELA